MARAETSELPIPSEAEGAEEVLRVFRSPDGYVIVAMAPFAFGSDPGGWGMLLVDLAHYVANGLDGVVFVTDGIASRGQLLARIKTVFDAEWSNRRTGTAARRIPQA
jgi:hypothetical protein